MSSASSERVSCTVPSPDDPGRLAALRAFDIMDTPPEAAFDRIAELAAHLFDAPFAAVNFVDAHRQWSKSMVGFDERVIHLDVSFCVHAIQSSGLTVVEDATEDDRFADNPFVTGDPGIRFYAGAPLETADGHRLGTVCVLDTTPHAPPADRRRQLQHLGAMAMDELELRSEVEQRQTMEHQLRAMTREYETVFDHTQDALFLIDVHGPAADPSFEIVRLNAAHEQVTGLSTEDVRGRTPRDVLGPGVGARVAANYRRCVAARDVIEYEEELPFPNGRRLFHTRLSPVMDDGTVTEIVGISRDITDRKKQEQRFQSLVQNMPGVVYQFAVAPDGTLSIPYISPSIETLTGVRPEQAMDDAEALLERMPPADRDAFAASMRASAHHLAPWEWEGRYTAPSGALRWVQAASQPRLQRDGTILWDGLLMDVTERKRAERALRRSRERLTHVQEIAHLGSWERNLQTGALYWSDETRRIFGWDPEEPVTFDDFMALVHPADRAALRAQQQRLREHGTPIDITFRITRPDGEERVIHERGAATLDARGVMTRLTGTVLDVTERTKRERELIAAKETAEEMNRLKSAFLTNMSHEIRTPLTSIIGFSELLRDMDLPASADQFTKLILRGGRRLLNTLNSVLDLSQLEAGSMILRPEEVSLRPLVRNLVERFGPQAREADVQLDVTVPSAPTRATIDPTALRRIVSNLISNAIKFTDGGGHVAVRLTAHPDTFVIDVTDTGVGIDPAFVPHLFEAFTQESTGDARAFEGSGLGLTITKRLVELLGGSITVESVKGEGSTFTVQLPRTAREDAPAMG